MKSEWAELVREVPEPGILIGQHSIPDSHDAVYWQQTRARQYEVYVYNGNKNRLTVLHRIFDTFDESEIYYRSLKEYR